MGTHPYRGNSVENYDPLQRPREARYRRQLDLSKGTVRYHLVRMTAGASEAHRALTAAAAHWMDQHDRCNPATLHACLGDEHSYNGSLRLVQRLVVDC